MNTCGLQDTLKENKRKFQLHDDVSLQLNMAFLLGSVVLMWSLHLCFAEFTWKKIWKKLVVSLNSSSSRTNKGSHFALGFFF